MDSIRFLLSKYFFTFIDRLERIEVVSNQTIIIGGRADLGIGR
jgi:hypothetical protein